MSNNDNGKKTIQQYDVAPPYGIIDIQDIHRLQAMGGRGVEWAEEARKHYGETYPTYTEEEFEKKFGITITPDLPPGAIIRGYSETEVPTSLPEKFWTEAEFEKEFGIEIKPDLPEDVLIIGYQTTKTPAKLPKKYWTEEQFEKQFGVEVSPNLPPDVLIVGYKETEKPTKLPSKYWTEEEFEKQFGIDIKPDLPKGAFIVGYKETEKPTKLPFIYEAGYKKYWTEEEFEKEFGIDIKPDLPKGTFITGYTKAEGPTVLPSKYWTEQQFEEQFGIEITPNLPEGAIITKYKELVSVPTFFSSLASEEYLEKKYGVDIKVPEGMGILSYEETVEGLRLTFAPKEPAKRYSFQWTLPTQTKYQLELLPPTQKSYELEILQAKQKGYELELMKKTYESFQLELMPKTQKAFQIDYFEPAKWEKDYLEAWKQSAIIKQPIREDLLSYIMPTKTLEKYLQLEAQGRLISQPVKPLAYTSDTLGIVMTGKQIAQAAPHLAKQVSPTEKYVVVAPSLSLAAPPTQPKTYSEQYIEEYKKVPTYGTMFGVSERQLYAQAAFIGRFEGLLSFAEMSARSLIESVTTGKPQLVEPKVFHAPPTLESSILQPQSLEQIPPEMRASYLAGSALGLVAESLLLSAATTKVWEGIKKIPGVAKTTSKAELAITKHLPSYRGSTLDVWLAKHSEWYLAKTGGIVKGEVGLAEEVLTVGKAGLEPKPWIITETTKVGEKIINARELYWKMIQTPKTSGVFISDIGVGYEGTKKALTVLAGVQAAGYLHEPLFFTQETKTKHIVSTFEREWDIKAPTIVELQEKGLLPFVTQTQLTRMGILPFIPTVSYEVSTKSILKSLGAIGVTALTTAITPKVTGEPKIFQPIITKELEKLTQVSYAKLEKREELFITPKLPLETVTLQKLIKKQKILSVQELSQTLIQVQRQMPKTESLVAQMQKQIQSAMARISGKTKTQLMPYMPTLEATTTKQKQAVTPFMNIQTINQQVTKQMQKLVQITIPDIPTIKIPKTDRTFITPFKFPFERRKRKGKREEDLFGKWFKRTHPIKTPREMLKTYGLITTGRKRKR